MASALSTPEIQEQLPALAGWLAVKDALEKTYEFADFSEALGFIVRVGVEAERLNHHPHLTNVWNRVTLRLNTHDAGNKITKRDFQLARAIEHVAGG